METEVWHDALEPPCPQIRFVDERVDRPRRIVFSQS